MEYGIRPAGIRTVATAESHPILELIRRVSEDPRVRELPEHELLRRFNARRDEAAFRTLLRRHGPMVLDVCRSLLPNEADVEDAFQATFLVLARNAGSVRKADSLASWLHGVARRTALKALARAAARRTYEARLPEQQHPGADDLSWREVRAVLHEELGRLPDGYREPLVLCYLEGVTQEVAAARLGLAARTLRERLERGRALLRARLVRRGLGPAAVLAVSAWPLATASACPSSALVNSTAEVAAGRAVGSVVSAEVTALTGGVEKAMFVTKLKVLCAALMATAVLCACVITRAQDVPARVSDECGRTPGDRKSDEKDKPKPDLKPIVVGEKAAINRLAWDAKGETVVTVGVTYEVVEVTVAGLDPLKRLLPSSTIKLRDAKTGELKLSLGEEKGVYLGNLTLSPDRKTAVVTAIKFTDEDGKPIGGSHGTEVRLMDAEKWELKRTVDADGLDAPVKPLVHAVAFSPDGKTLAMGGASPRVKGGCFLKLWDVQKEKLIGGTKEGKEADGDSGFPEAVTSLAFSRDGKLLAAGCMDGKLRLFDGRTGELKKVWDDEVARFACVVFSPDGETLVCQSRDRTVKVWDVQTAKVLRTLQGNKASVTAMAFSPDGKLFTTGGSVWENDKVTGGEVILWDAQTGDLKHTLPGLTVPVSTLSFSPDGKTLAVAGGSGAYGDLKDGGKTAGEIKLFPLESLTTTR